MLGAARKISVVYLPAWSHVVTQGASLGFTGYNDGNPGLTYGSVSPTTYSGSTIKGIYYDDSTADFYVIIDGHVAQDFFTFVRPEGTSILFSAAADSYQQTDDLAPDRTIWSWNTGVVPDPWDGSGGVNVAFG